jgi:hypothetical protein
MKHYEFSSRFRTIYDQAVAAYGRGHRGAAGMVPPAEADWLAANGIALQHLYDYAEDHNNYSGEPGFEQALGIELVRRDYFLNVQAGRPSGTTLNEGSLPAKDVAVRGIAWLPRLLPKARAKLRGELPASLMYCCGGDRKFFKEHNILPAVFLALIWRAGNDDNAVVDWVVQRRGQA